MTLQPQRERAPSLRRFGGSSSSAPRHGTGALSTCKLAPSTTA